MAKVTRYDYEICCCALGTHVERVESKDGGSVSASDYATLAKQARALAGMVLETCAEFDHPAQYRIDLAQTVLNATEEG